MKEKLLQHITEQKLFGQDDNILVTVSGGIDSCVMVNLLYSLHFKCIVAHCNFKLRGNDSDEDEVFVKNLATKYNFSFVSKSFNTIQYSTEKGISIQMAARELRYQFFEEVAKDQNCSVIATAHHADDSIETIFINLIHGTGLKGLGGIPVKSGKIVRPLLFAFRSEIEEYARINHLPWRNDKSNSSNKYTRNKIRNQILPLIEEIKPQFKNVMLRNISNFKDSEGLLNELLNEKTNKLVQQKGNSTYISIAELTKIKVGETILFHLVSPFGFNSKQIEKIWNCLNTNSGKMFYSKNNILNKDRDFLIISEINNISQQRKYYIDEYVDFINEPIELSIEKIPWENNQIIPKDKNIFLADAKKITFPLIIRRWKPGDYFQPFGMQGMKKISDFFIDEKISNSEKSNIWIIESNGKIVWVVNHRPDERFKITSNTQYVIKLQSL